MRKAALVLMAILLIVLSFNLGIFAALLMCAAGFFLVIMIAVFLYTIHFKKQAENEIWEDEP
ncbi:MAG: hypothetical protein ACOX05_05605 [Bacillota bacterium]|jgi:heme O synthase-like polyprenyltransferase